MQRRIKKPPPLPQTSKMKISEKTVKDFQFLTAFAKNSISEVWPGF